MKNEYYLLIAGIVGIAAATSLSFLFNNVWIGFFTGILVGTIYLYVLDKKVVSNLNSTGNKRITRILVVAMLLCQLAVSLYAMSNSQRQHRILADIKGYITENIAQIEAEQVMIKALTHYHLEAEIENRTVSQSFLEIAGDRVSEDGFYLPEDSTDFNLVYKVDIPQADSVIIRINTDETFGYDSDFVNSTGSIGKYQAAAILTPKGVSYEREN